MVGDILKCTATVKRVLFYNEETNSGIILIEVNELKSGTVVYDNNGSVSLKGEMFKVKSGDKLLLTASETLHKDYGSQYVVVSIANQINYALETKTGQKTYLSSLFTEKQIEALYSVLPDPFDSFKNGRYEEITQVKGIGFLNANKMIGKFNNSLPLSMLYIELENYNLSLSLMKKLLEEYKCAEIAIKKVKENPYTLVEIDGIGFTKADYIAMSGGVGEYSIDRVKAYILFYLETQASNGFSWVSCNELMSAIIETIGENVADFTITEAIGSLKHKLWWNEEKTKIGLGKYRTLEDNIAKHLLRIKNAKSNFKYENWEDVLKHMEHKQGWEYAEQQIAGIKGVLDNNIMCVHGLAGCGKSTIAEGMLEILKSYSSALTALSGRAASRIASITGREGYTIHRLLGYPNYDEGCKNGFFYHEDNPLPFDIIIIDEISMINGFLFLSLIRAIKDGAKVVLLGDIGQLESIGECNIAYDIINSPEIPTIELDQIYRQAVGSAIISESRKARRGAQLIDNGWSGVVTLGEFQDLTIDAYSDNSNTFYKVMQYFQENIGKVNSIMDLQIISPIKEKGQSCCWEINTSVQELYNPLTKNKKEISVFYKKGLIGVLREGDKVINVKNNYKTVNTNNKITPIFNGNLGIVKEIRDDESIVVGFEDAGNVVIEKGNLKSIELAYAITCHKMQGSQAERVIFALDFSMYSLLSRELVYTAVTRAQKHCIMVCQNSALRHAIYQDGVNRKTTHLQDCLKEQASPKINKLIF